MRNGTETDLRERRGLFSASGSGGVVGERRTSVWRRGAGRGGFVGRSKLGVGVGTEVQGKGN